jgi:hypothetical protein
LHDELANEEATGNLMVNVSSFLPDYLLLKLAIFQFERLLGKLIF